MGKLWDELQEVGIEDAIHRAITTTPIGSMIMYINKEGTMVMPVLSMTDATIMSELRQLVADGEHYRQDNLKQYEDALAQSRSESQRNEIRKTIYVLRNLSALEVIINIPKFIRLCFEMIERGYDLEDIFYDPPN